ncbi:MAG: hypothetical protein J1F22_04615 [Lachnospiraceae bacterium]|nr:hypothetical protein [Lachnospiraceae bacterium]
MKNRRDLRMEIPIAQNEEEIDRIGHDLYDQHKKVYNANMLKMMKRELPPDNSVNFEDNFFKFVYYYWLYGASVSDYYKFRLYDLTHEDIKKYITMRWRVIYSNLLNNGMDYRLTEDKYRCYKVLKKYYKREMIFIASVDGHREAFYDFVQKNPCFFVKPLDLGEGKGINYYDASGYNSADFDFLFGKIWGGRQCIYRVW